MIQYINILYQVSDSILCEPLVFILWFHFIGDRYTFNKVRYQLYFFNFLLEAESNAL